MTSSCVETVLSVRVFKRPAGGLDCRVLQAGVMTTARNLPVTVTSINTLFYCPYVRVCRNNVRDSSANIPEEKFEKFSDYFVALSLHWPHKWSSGDAFHKSPSRLVTKYNSRWHFPANICHNVRGLLWNWVCSGPLGQAVSGPAESPILLYCVEM